MSLSYNGNKIPFARFLRKNMTPQERRLWYEFLSRYPVRFQRQKVIGEYIADFYCHTARLVIELDGSQHFSDSGEQYDGLRTKKLEQYDLRVIRFTNLQIEKNFRDVCEYIDMVVKEIINAEK